MKSLKQIRTDEIPKYRHMYAVKHKFKCPICKCPMAGKRITLDHCHKTGRLRSTICHSCNQAEGRVGSAMRMYNRKDSYIVQNPSDWLRALADYLDYHEENPSNFIHPTFDTKTKKQEKQRRRKTHAKV